MGVNFPATQEVIAVKKISVALQRELVKALELASTNANVLQCNMAELHNYEEQIEYKRQMERLKYLIREIK